MSFKYVYNQSINKIQINHIKNLIIMNKKQTLLVITIRKYEFKLFSIRK